MTEPALRATAVPLQLLSEVEGFDPAAGAGLFIGVRYFPADDSLAEVPFAVDDAIDLAFMFSHTLGLMEPHRLMMALQGEPQKPESRRRLDELVEAGAMRIPADQTSVYRAFGDVINAVRKGGLLVVAAATHGFQHGGEDYLVVASSLRQRLAQTGILIRDFIEDIRNAPSPLSMLLLDTCREALNDGARGLLSPPLSGTLERSIRESRGQVILAAAAAGGYAYDDPARGNGVFTAAVIDALTGAAEPDERGFITPATLAPAVNRRVAEWGRNHTSGRAHAAGIAFKAEGSAARLPLSMIPDRVAARRRTEVRRGELLAFFGTTLGWPGITGTLLEKVRLALEDPTTEAEAILERIERLRTIGKPYSEDFVAWWLARDRETFRAALAEPASTPAPPPSAPALVTVGVADSMEVDYTAAQSVDQSYAASLRDKIERWIAFNGRWPESPYRLHVDARIRVLTQRFREKNPGVEPPLPPAPVVVEEKAPEPEKVAPPPKPVVARPPRDLRPSPALVAWLCFAFLFAIPQALIAAFPIKHKGNEIMLLLMGQDVADQFGPLALDYMFWLGVFPLGMAVLLGAATLPLLLIPATRRGRWLERATQNAILLPTLMAQLPAAALLLLIDEAHLGGVLQRQELLVTLLVALALGWVLDWPARRLAARLARPARVT